MVNTVFFTVRVDLKLWLGSSIALEGDQDQKQSCLIEPLFFTLAGVVFDQC